MIMEKSFSGNFLIRLDNHPSAESFNQLMNPCWKVSPPDGTILRNFQSFCGMIASILHPWVVVGTHGHQRVVRRSTDCTAAAGGGTQRPTVQCIAMNLQQLDTVGQQWKEREAGCSSLVPAVPPLSLLPATHQLTLERSLVCPDPAYFPHLTGTQSTPIYIALQKLQACLARGGIELNQPATFPSSRWRGGGWKN